MYQVVKRDGKIAEFDINKIAEAIKKAFESQEKQYHPSTIDFLALKVTADFEPKIKDGLIKYAAEVKWFKDGKWVTDSTVFIERVCMQDGLIDRITAEWAGLERLK